MTAYRARVVVDGAIGKEPLLLQPAEIVDDLGGRSSLARRDFGDIGAVADKPVVLSR